MNLGQIVDYSLYKLGKDLYGGYLTPDNLNEFILEAVNYEMLNKYTAVYEARRTITDDIRPFVKTLGDNANPAITLDAYGYGNLPADYIAYAAVYVNTFVNSNCTTAQQVPRMVEMMNTDKFNYRKTNGALKPRAKDPIGTIQNDKLYIQPPVFPSCVLTYIRQPIAAYFDYDIVNDEIVYLPPGTVHANSSVEPTGSPSLSVEFEWPEQVHEDLGDIIVKYCATNFRSEFNLQALDLSKPQ